MKLLQWLLIPGLICLTACAPETSRPPTVDSLCPEPVAYGADFQQQLADELEALPVAHTALWQAMMDYGRLRAALRVC